MLIDIYGLVVIFSFLVSLISFTYRYPWHLRLFSILLGFTALTEVAAIAIVHKYIHWINGKNYFIYNSFIIIEFVIYAAFYYQISLYAKVRKLILLLTSVYILFWYFSVFWINGFYKWNSYVITVEGIFAVFCAITYLNQILKSDKLIRLYSHPEFWIATGMLIFYSCQAPFFGMLNYLVKNYRVLSTALLNVVDVLNILMYLIFTYAFLCPLIHKKSLSQS